MPTGSPLEILLVAVAGMLGALSRYGINLFARWLQGPPPPNTDHFPYGTLGVNVAGCLVIGYFATLFRGNMIQPVAYYALTVGFLGAFTTFSTFGLDTFDLADKGQYGEAI